MCEHYRLSITDDAIKAYWKSDTDIAGALFFKAQCASNDYYTSHNLGVFLLYEHVIPLSKISDDMQDDKKTAMDWLLIAEKHIPHREKNVLALAMCYYYRKAFMKSIDILTSIYPAHLLDAFAWMKAINYMALHYYQKAIDLLRENIHSEAIYAYWALYATIQCKYLMHETIHDVVQKFRICIRDLRTMVPDASLYEEMLMYGIPVLILFGCREDQNWIKSNHYDHIISDAANQALSLPDQRNQSLLIKEFLSADLSAVILPDLFEKRPEKRLEK